jgi:2-methylisocitrate lyase-like PEP mutase family enzyme
MATVAEKREQFRRMHETGCFVLPNPWDIGTTRYLQQLGFKAVATTSAGAAWSLGCADGETTLDAMLDHIHMIAEAADVPTNADFGDAFASDPEGVAANVRRCAETGVAALSVEDSTPDRANPLHAFDLAVERIKAAAAALAGTGVLLVARSECFLTGHPEPLKEAIRRLTAFAEAGADCLYAPGVMTREDIAAIVKAVAPKPVNVLSRGPGLNVAEIAELGARRISVGGSLARVAWTGFTNAARELVERGTFGGFEGAMSNADVNKLFARRS